MKLPANYTPPSASGGRYKGRLQPGETWKCRILSEEPLLGNVAWIDTADGPRPVRRPLGELLPPEARDHKHFWAILVWDHDAEEMALWEPTQRQIQDGIRRLMEDPDWGDPAGYDLKISRHGSSKTDTVYTVAPCPKQDLPGEAKAAWRESRVDLTALFRGGDPFASPVEVEGSEEGEDAIPF